jgi:tetratricopeptide (TPR) repeat protein
MNMDARFDKGRFSYEGTLASVSFSHSKYFFAICILVTLLGLSCACVRTTRTVSHDEFYVLRVGKKKAAKNKIPRDQRITDLSDSIRKTFKAQGKNATRAKTDLINTEVLEEKNSEVALLLMKIKDDRGKAENHFALALIYHRYRIFDKAYAEYQRAILLDPKNPSYFEGMGRLWRDWGAPRFGINDLQKALQLRADFLEAWNSLGTIYDELGDFSQAQQCYMRAMELNPYVGFIHNNLCFSYLLVGESAKAIFHGEKAIELDPSLRIAHNNLGLAYGMANNFDRAIQEFRLASDEAGAHNNLGMVFLKKHKNLEAMEQFRLAAKLRPFYKVAIQNYLYAWGLKHEMDKKRRKETFDEGKDLLQPLVDVTKIWNSESEALQLSYFPSNSWFTGPESAYLWASEHIPVIDFRPRNSVEDRVIKVEIAKAKTLGDESQNLWEYLGDKRYGLSYLLEMERPLSLPTAIYVKSGFVFPALQLAQRVRGNQYVLKERNVDPSFDFKIVKGRDVLPFIKKIRAALNRRLSYSF